MAQEPTLPAHVFLTQAGLHRLRGRIAEARAAYLSVCSDNEDAAGAGDSSVWHDNFAYEENQRQMHRLARRVRDLEELLSRVRLVPACATAPARVQLGAQVQLLYPEDGREATIYIAGYEDGDPRIGRVSYSAPLAARLIGAEPGEVRRIQENGKSREVEVQGVLAAPAEELP